MTTFLEAKTPKTVAELRTQILATLAAPPAPLVAAPVAGWSASAPQRILVEDFASRMSEETMTRANLAAMIDLSELEGLDRDWARVFLTWFDEEFIPALPAYWDVPCQVLPASSPLTVGASTVIQIQATGGPIFLLEQASDVLFSASSSPTPYQGTLRFRARTSGVVGNVSASTLLNGRILTGPAGLSLGPSAPSLFTAGRDEETPVQAIARALAKWSTLGAGWTRESFDYLIPRIAPPVTRWLVRDDNPIGMGSVQVIAANAAGPATSEETSALLAGLGANNVKPLGSGKLGVVAADELAVNVAAVLTEDGSNPDVLTDADAAITTYLERALPMGATIEPALLESLLLGLPVGSVKVDVNGTSKSIAINAPGFGGVTGVSLASPGAPVTLAVDELADFTTVIT